MSGPGYRTFDLTWARSVSLIPMPVNPVECCITDKPTLHGCPPHFLDFSSSFDLPAIGLRNRTVESRPARTFALCGLRPSIATIRWP